MGYSSSGIKQHDYSAFEQNAVDGAPDRRVGIKSSIPLSLGVDNCDVWAPAAIAGTAVNVATTEQEEFIIREVTVAITATATGAHAIIGTHDGLGNAAVLTDTTKGWLTNSLVGATVNNTTDGSSGTILSNTGSTITATLAGGGDNDWDVGDAYTIDNCAFLNFAAGTFGVNALVGRTLQNTTDGSSGMITSNTATTVIATLSGGTQNDWDNGDAFSIAASPTAPTTAGEILVMLDSCRGPAFDAVLARLDPSPAGLTSICFSLGHYVEGVHFGHGLVPSVHDGLDNAAALTDTTAAWPVNGLVGLSVVNVTDGSSGTITANTGTVITATLSGGAGNDWDIGDAYTIDGQDQVRVVYNNVDGRTIGVRFVIIES